METRGNNFARGLLRVLAAVYFLLSVGLITLLFVFDVAPLKFRIAAAVVFFLIFLMLRIPASKVKKTGGLLALSLFAIPMILVNVWGAQMLFKGTSTLDHIHKITTQEDEQGNKITDREIIKRNHVTHPIVMYVTGIDTYGDLSTVSRSDVNILLVANPKTHEMLMISVPRDSYVRIPGKGQNEYDKLTHAGNYGVDASIGALEQLFDIDIPYFTRVNFSSFIQIIDALGGITIENPYAFTSYEGHFFPEGRVNLDGELALQYVRERYSLPDGAIDRDRHQQIVLSATINKMMSPHLLLNFNEIMDSIKDSIQINMHPDDMMDLVNYQLDDGSAWKIHKRVVQGEGQMGLPSFAMPGYDLYMYVIDDDALEVLKGEIQDVLDGNYLQD